MNKLVVIDIWKGKAYLPAQGQFESGIWADIEPVLVTSLDLKELAAAIQKVFDKGYIRLPEPTREEWQKRKSPILAATGARSWKELAYQGASYTIGWTEREVRVDMSRLDKKGRWENDPQRVHIFPLDTPLEAIAAIILDDVRSRPELFDS